MVHTTNYEKNHEDKIDKRKHGGDNEQSTKKVKTRRLVIIVANQGILRRLVERRSMTLRRRLRGLKAISYDALKKLKVINNQTLHAHTSQKEQIVDYRCSCHMAKDDFSFFFHK